MKISFGHLVQQGGETNYPAVWDTSKTINPHGLVLGDSGSGKSYTLRQIIAQSFQSDNTVRSHIFDSHGDLVTKNDPLIRGASTVRFSESSDSGLNPLELCTHPDFGGVRKKIQSFIQTIARTSHKLGVRQEAVVRNLLTDLYAANGFKSDDPNTWFTAHEESPTIVDGRIYLDVPYEEKDRARAAGAEFDRTAKLWYIHEDNHDGALLRWGPKQFGKRYPTLLDAVRFAKKRLNTLYFGANTATMHFLDEVNRAAKSLLTKEIQAQKRGEAVAGAEQIKSDLMAAKSKCASAFKNYVESIRTGRELEENMRHESAETMKSIVDRFENLYALGIFRNSSPRFNEQSPFWHYDITALDDEVRRLLVYFRLEAIFADAIMHGESATVRELIIIDEADLYTSDDPDNILNRIVKQGRKFGLAIILASQAPHHFSDDLLAGVAFRMILGVDKFYWPILIKKLGLEERSLKYVIPKRQSIAQVKHSGEAQSKCLWIKFVSDVGNK